MKVVFAYIRVSTVKQGQQGSSLQEQRDAITAYAQRYDLSIVRWFQETETAAIQGRRAFGQLLDALGKGQARGVIIHKIDRSARNLKDWANLGDLIDGGAEIHFAHESIDLTSRGGRLSADIQAVVAADFIRNLRQETRKGFYGRIKQGLYPLRAPIGYRDAGRGQVKTLDLFYAPLIKAAFELYSSGEFNFDELREELTLRGLRNKNGRPVTNNGLTTILNNPFYMGLIHLRKSNEIFQGAHTPIITKRLYDEVQLVLRGKRVPNAVRHDPFARRLIECARCKLHLIGEIQKKRYVYYRCHTKGCDSSVSERAVEQVIEDALSPLKFDAGELRDFGDLLNGLRETSQTDNKRMASTLQLRIAETESRLARLADAFIDGSIDKELFEQRKKAILETRREWKDQLAYYQSGTPFADTVAANIELMNTAYSVYKTGLLGEKRAMLKSMTSNFTCSGKKLAITLKSPFEEVQKTMISAECDLRRDAPRTRAAQIFEMLMKTAEVDIQQSQSIGNYRLPN